MDSKNLTIGALSTTAVILLVGLITVHSRPQPAWASGVGVQGGDYVLAVGKFEPDTEVVYVIHAPSNRMRTYGFNYKTGQILLIPQIWDLAQLRMQAQPGAPVPSGGRRRGRGP